MSLFLLLFSFVLILLHPYTLTYETAKGFYHQLIMKLILDSF